MWCTVFHRQIQQCPGWVSCHAALAQTVAANNLCTSYQAFNTNYHDTGLFGIIATADKTAAIDDLSWAIMHEVGGSLGHCIMSRTVQRVCRVASGCSRAAGRMSCKPMSHCPADHEAGVRGVGGGRHPGAQPAEGLHPVQHGRIRRCVTLLCARCTSRKLFETSDLHECHPTLPACDPAAAVAEDIGRGLLVYGRRIPKAEIFARLDAVNAETIKVNTAGSLPKHADVSLLPAASAPACGAACRLACYAVRRCDDAVCCAAGCGGAGGV